MADKKLQERIIKFLNGKPKKTEVFATIIQALRVPKKSVNIQLYILQTEGRVHKVQESPPVWAVLDGAKGRTPSTRSTRSRQQPSDEQGTDVLERKILVYLLGMQKACKSLEIAKATGHSRASYVNTLMYDMLKRKLVEKKSEKPPTWIIAHAEGAVKVESPPHSSTMNEPFATDHGIPMFQDTKLFKTELAFETDSSELYTSVDNDNAGCGYDHIGIDGHAHVTTYSDDEEFVPDSDLGVSRELHTPDLVHDSFADISTQGTFNVFKKTTESNISDDNSHSLETEGEKIRTGEHDTESMHVRSFNTSTVKVEEDGNEMIPDCSYSDILQKGRYDQMETENINSKHKLDDAPEFAAKRPKTFRDMFNLDDPVSDDTSSSYDSNNSIAVDHSGEGDSSDCQDMKGVVDLPVEKALLTFSSSFNEHNVVSSLLGNSIEGNFTPELQIAEKATPEQTAVPSAWNTPQVVNAVLDMQENVIEGEGKEIQSETVFYAESSNFTTTDDSASLPKSELAKDELSHVEMDTQSDDNAELTGRNETEVEQTDSDMKDCDKVLKVLAELKGIAQFILKKKTDITPETLDDVLQKCLSLNFVSGSSKLWKITDDGINYISKKTGANDTISPKVFVEPERKLKQIFKGPPPSPMSLLGKEGTSASLSGFHGTSANRNNNAGGGHLDKCRPSHSPDSLFKPPTARIHSNVALNETGVNVSTSSYCDISDLNSNGLKSLMSVQLNSDLTEPGKFKQPNCEATYGSLTNVNTSVFSSGISSQNVNGPQPLMSLQFDSKPMDKSKLSNQHVRSLMKDQENAAVTGSLNIVQMTNQDVSNIYAQNQQTLTSGLWDLGSNSAAFGQSTLNVIAKSPQVPMTDFSTNKSFSISSNSVGLTQKIASSQNMRKTIPVVEQPPKRHIPEKYADYPNKSTSLQSLKSKPQSASKSVSSGQSKSAFAKAPPPSPLDILSKGLKKTDISPPGSFQASLSVSCPSGSYSTMSQMSSNKNAAASSQINKPETKSSFLTGHFSGTASQKYGSSAVGKQIVTVNQSSFSQSASIFGNQNRQTGFQSMLSSVGGPQSATSQAGPSSLRAPASRPVTGGPPPPPAVKLRLQSAQQAAQAVVQAAAQPPRPQQNMSKPNLGLALSSENFAALNKNPVSALMEYAQSRKLVARIEVIGRRGSSHKPTFELAAFVGDKKFPSVNCHNKKEGRKEACDIALRQLIAQGQFQAEHANTSSAPAVPQANMTHFDTIAALTHRGFTALVSQITVESFAGRKVIAGLVMKRSADDTGVLISLGTGNRCITGPQMSLQGNTVNDSHAEIITRRGFLRFLYKQLLDFDPSCSHPMFERSPSGKLQIRSTITFHLYISTAPCGDGALFSPRDAESSKAPLDNRIRPPHEPTFSSNVQGLLRTKVEGGEGTIPIEPGFKGQTFDGIQRGERLRTMSCTDKICRWNVVGMQGALLSHFLEPIYLDSLTLGLLYDHGHLCRAVCCRVGRGTADVETELPSGYRLNHPWLGRVTICDPPREVQKTKALSVNWSFGDKGPEVTDGTLGLCYTSIEKGFFSRCSKRSLFTNFKTVCEKFGRQDLLSVSSYNEAKIAADDFVTAKQTMLKRFKQNGFGKWVSKPVEEEMFGFEEFK